MTTDSAVKSLAAGRIAAGAGAWLAPNLFVRALRLDLAGNQRAAYVSRLFGARDVALGIGTLSTRAEARRTWLVAGLACDAADFGAAVLGRRSGSFSSGTAVLLAAPALAATALGALAVGNDLRS